MTQANLKRANLIGAIIFMVVGLLIAGWFILRPERIKETPRARSGELVTVVEAASAYAAPRVHAQGLVIPAREVTVQPEISGRIIKRHAGLVDGGVVQKGETLLQIDPRDYRIALQEARTGVDVAKAELAMEEGRQVVARQEWERFGADDEKPPPLALREPQLMQAELAIHSAQQRLHRAQLDFERTSLKAPFTALVTKADLEVGELVGPSTSAAKLVALDEFWVKVAIPLETLDLLTIPGRGADVGSRARVRHESGARQIEQKGRIIRLLGDLDPAGRMAQVLVSVQDPFWASEHRESQTTPKTPVLRSHPLMLGSYVSVEFEGADPRTVILLPRVAVREGKYLYIADKNDELEIREVEFAWKSRDTVAVENNLEPGERVIISGLAAPVQGMPLRVELAEDLPELQSPPFDPEPDADDEDPADNSPTDSSEASADEPDDQLEADAADADATDDKDTQQGPEPPNQQAEDVKEEPAPSDEKDAAEAEPAADTNQDSDQDSKRSSSDASRDNESEPVEDAQ